MRRRLPRRTLRSSHKQYRGSPRCSSNQHSRYSNNRHNRRQCSSRWLSPFHKCHLSPASRYSRAWDLLQAKQTLASVQQVV